MKRYVTTALSLLLLSLVWVSPADATRYGASYASRANPDEVHWAGKAAVARIFESRDLGVWSDYPEAQRAYDDGVRRFSFSWKGTSGQDVRDFAASIPDGVKVFGTWIHEPEDDIEAGTMTLDYWKANTIRLARVMTNHGIVPTRILMAWTLFPISGRDVTDYDLPKGTIRVSAFDGHVHNKSPETVARLILRDKARTGLPLALPETSGPPDKITTLRTLLDKKMWWGCYFTYHGMTQEQADAWFGKAT